MEKEKRKRKGKGKGEGGGEGEEGRRMGRREIRRKLIILAYR